MSGYGANKVIIHRSMYLFFRICKIVKNDKKLPVTYVEYLDVFMINWCISPVLYFYIDEYFSLFIISLLVIYNFISHTSPDQIIEFNEFNNIIKRESSTIASVHMNNYTC